MVSISQTHSQSPRDINPQRLAGCFRLCKRAFIQWQALPGFSNNQVRVTPSSPITSSMRFMLLVYCANITLSP